MTEAGVDNQLLEPTVIVAKAKYNFEGKNNDEVGSIFILSIISPLHSSFFSLYFWLKLSSNELLYLFELTFCKNDIITITQQIEGGWWEGTINGKTGWFPSNYASIITEKGIE